MKKIFSLTAAVRFDCDANVARNFSISRVWYNSRKES